MRNSANHSGAPFLNFNIMDKETSSTSSSGIGFLGLLTIVFITLKLLNKIDWSWWWVLSPLWLPIAAAGILYVVFLIIMVIKAIFFGDD